MQKVEKNNPMQLNEGNVVCTECGGVGRVRAGNYRRNCLKCNGKGQLDWIENIMGRKQKLIEVANQRAVRNYVNAKCAK